MRRIMVAMPLAAAFALSACAPTPGTPEAFAYEAQKRKEEQVATVKSTADDAPSWYVKPPKDAVSVYAAGTAVSSDMQLAVDKATLTAKRTLADGISSAVSAKMKQFTGETGSSEDPVVTSEAQIVTTNLIAEANVAGYSREETKLIPQGVNYRAYVLLRYPVGEANRILVDQVKKNAVLDTKLRASKAFQELEKDIESARNRNGQKAN